MTLRDAHRNRSRLGGSTEAVQQDMLRAPALRKVEGRADSFDNMAIETPSRGHPEPLPVSRPDDRSGMRCASTRDRIAPLTPCQYGSADAKGEDQNDQAGEPSLQRVGFGRRPVKI